MTPTITASGSDAVAAAPQAAPRKGIGWFFSMENPYLAPVLITCILIAGYLTYGFIDLPKTIGAILASIATEIVLGLLILKRVPPLASAYVSGISCGILLKTGGEWWPFLLAGVIATSSKYVIRVNNRHLWNPSNLAIVILLLVAHDSVATLSVQAGNDYLPMVIVWCLGAAIVARLKRFHICATYVASFFFFAWVRTLFTGQTFWMEAAPITGPMYQLFIFFMITDPKTTTQRKWAQMTVAFLVAAMECALRLWAPTLIASHAPYFALTIMGPTSNLIEIYLQWKAKKAALVEAPAAVPA
jgi:enediyne biosynthesis protein E5